MAEALQKKVVRGAVWTLLEKLSVQVVGFVVSMVLARLLTPADYGTVALTTIFFAITGVLVDGGMSNALIQKKDADELDFNSVFYLNVALAIIGYAGLYFCAPQIAKFYDAPILTGVIRVSAFSLIINSVNAIQNAELIKRMLFHLSFRISLITCMTSAVCGITLAYLGYGVWALVWSSLMTGVVGVFARWLIIAWRPRLVFSWRRLKPLFSYGWKMLASGLIDTVFTNINGLLIGRFYTKADLAFVNKGESLPRLAMSQIDDTLGRVSFPALVQMQESRERLRNGMRRMIRCSTFLVFPLMVFVALCARSELRLLFGEQWLPAAPYMMLSCFSFALWPFHTINLRGVMTLGRSDIFLKLEIIKKTARLLVIVFAFRYGLFVFMALLAFALGPLSVIVNAWPNKRLLGYSVGMQLKDVLPSALLCICEACAIFAVEYCVRVVCHVNGVSMSISLLVLTLAMQFIAAVMSYFSLAYLFKVAPMMDYLSVMGQVLPRVSQKLYNARRMKA